MGYEESDMRSIVSSPRVLVGVELARNEMIPSVTAIVDESRTKSLLTFTSYHDLIRYDSTRIRMRQDWA